MDLRATQSTKTFSNPYLKSGGTHNLEVYLEALRTLPYSGHLLVGEALGYRGGALTGIPFSSSPAPGQTPSPISYRSSIEMGPGREHDRIHRDHGLELLTQLQLCSSFLEYISIPSTQTGQSCFKSPSKLSRERVRSIIFRPGP